MKPTVAIPLALVLALVFAVPALAAPPVIETGTRPHDYVIDPPICPFEVRDRFVNKFHETSLYDNDGNLVRFKAHYWGDEEVYNPANGVVLNGHFSVTFNTNMLTGEQTYSGAYYSVEIPGYGGVLKTNGHAFADGDFAGINTLSDPEALAQLCALLAGELPLP